MEVPYGNPTDWFNRLDEMNKNLIDGGKYVKREYDIKLQIRLNLPEEGYSQVITPFKDYLNMSLKEEKKEIKWFHGLLKMTNKIKKSKEESIIQVNNKEYKVQNKWNRQFKGKIYSCGEPGYQASECTKNKKKNYGRQQRRNVKCYIFGGNHYATDCPQKKQNPEEVQLFVGVTCIIREKPMKEMFSNTTEIDVVSTMLGNMSTNQLFETEGNNPQVFIVVNQLLSDWLG